MPGEPADVTVSLACFEHYEDSAAVLRAMAACLKPDGKVLVSFGCTWYRPYGGHLFSLFPWAHLLFTERAMLAWRKQSHPEQKARTVKECGLNKMTIRLRAVGGRESIPLGALRDASDQTGAAAAPVEPRDARIPDLDRASDARSPADGCGGTADTGPPERDRGPAAA